MKMTKHYDLVAIGESVIDFISEVITDNLGETNRYRLYIGGQVTNLAANMARLGKQVALATCWGMDGLGQHLRQELNSNGVDLQFVQETHKAPTTTSIITRNLNTPDFIIHRGADIYLSFSQPLFETIKQSEVVHTSAFALSHDPARSSIINLLAEAKIQNKIISLDPNYHPGIWPDTPDFIDLLQLAFQYATITKPSLDDCHRLLGEGKTPHEYAEVFKSWGVKIVVITMGKDGVFLSDQEGDCFLVQPSQVDVVDVTGAGDAFWSGLITGILEGHSVLEAVLAGQVIAEIKLKSLGPIRNMPSWEQILNSTKSIMYTEC
jgi:fructokinase